MNNETQTLLSHIVENTYTVGDIHRRLGTLRQTVEHVLFTQSNIPFMEACAEFLSRTDEVDTQDVRALEQWGEPVFKAFTQQNVAARISSLQTEIDMLPVLTLYIPVEFPAEEITFLGQWARTHCHESVMMDVHIDPAVVGGCAFVWNDAYHEFSFRTRIKEHVGIITTTLSDYAK